MLVNIWCAAIEEPQRGRERTERWERRYGLGFLSSSERSSCWREIERVQKCLRRQGHFCLIHVKYKHNMRTSGMVLILTKL
jgi:hypothetical protein